MAAADAGVPEATARRNTLFVTRLPFNVTSTDLSTFFSDVGPLRRAFVVADKDSKKSKGVGYVTYADAADAQRALDTLQGHSIDGSRRHLQLQWADRKPAREMPASAETDAAPKQKRPPPTARTELPARDPEAPRTIVVSGLAGCTPPADVKTLYKRARKIGDVENVEFVKDGASTSQDVAEVRFRTPNHAMTAVSKLHAHTFKGALVSVDLKKRIEAAKRREQHMRPETLQRLETSGKRVADAGRSGSTAMPTSHEGRLIVRNLPFDVTVDDIRAVFLRYGAVYEVKLPRKGDEAAASADANARNRGFAFVWFVSRSDAARAMEGVNGQQLGHGMAQKAALKSAKGKEGRAIAKKALEEAEKGAQPARPVAVDWSLAQKNWLAREDDAEDNAEDDVEDGDDASVAEAPSKKRRRSDAESTIGDSASDATGDEDESVDEDDGEDEGDAHMQAAKPQLTPPEAGTTLFVRNLPFQATEEELRDLFRPFGPMRYARIAMDPATQRSRGTGFVNFWKRESADSALARAELVQQETSAPSGQAKKSNPFTIPSVITADPSAPLVSDFTLHGRVLHVVRAVPRETASELETAARNAREKSDKRNTWLLREGVPFPNTTMASALNEADIDKRMRCFSMRRSQLGANPSLHVSKTRLAVHQLPLFMTNKLLKRLALHACKAFNSEVRAGQRADLSAEEKADTTQSHATKSEEAPASKKKKDIPPSAVVQSKVVLQNERIDPLTGQGRSRGYGFLEMRSFQHALKVLRWANANADLTGLMTSWWKDELDAQIAKLRVKRDAERSADSADSADTELRIKRMERAREDIAEHGTKAVKSEFRGLLRIEFSIENVSTVRTRLTRQSQALSAKKRKVCACVRPPLTHPAYPQRRRAAPRRGSSATRCGAGRAAEAWRADWVNHRQKTQGTDARATRVIAPRGAARSHVC